MNSPKSRPKDGTNTGRGTSYAPDVLPASLEAERAVLGSMMLEAGSLSQALGVLSRDDFFSESNRIIFDKIADLSDRDRAVDIVTVVQELSTFGLLDKSGGASYVASLVDGIVPGNVRDYARIIREKAIIRRTINASNNVIARALEGTDDATSIVEFAQDQISEIEQDSGQTSGPISMREVVKQATESGYLSRMFEGTNQSAPGIPMGLTDLDSITTGIKTGELTLIAARPSVGKSALAFQLASDTAKAGTGVGLFSIEMTKEAVLQRMVCSGAKVDSHKVRTGFVSREDCQKALMECQALMQCPLFLDDSANLSIGEFVSRAKRLKVTEKVRMVIVDYLQLVSTKRRFDTREAEVSYIARSLKRLAKSEDLAVVACAQLNRETEKGLRGRPPKLSDLRESGSLEQESDLVMFIHLPHKRGDEPTVEIIVGKQRNGPTGKVPVVFLKKYTRFANAAPEESEEEVNIP